MIEIVYNKPDKEAVSTKEVKLPKSVRQVGDGGSMRKIYIEDYVMSYINTLAKRMKERLLVGVLLGSSVSDGEQYLFIKGAIRVKDFAYEEGRIILSENSWSGIYDDINKYFNTLNIMGWFVILEDLSEFHFDNLRKTHVDNFAGNEKTLFVFETDNKEGNFFFYDEGSLKRESGYYVYYERNENMQEYMVVKDSKENVKEEVTDVETIKVTQKSNKKMINYMYVVTTALALFLLVMSVSMLNSYEKLDKVSDTIDSLALTVITDKEEKASKVEVVNVDGNVYKTEPVTEAVTEPVTELATTKPNNIPVIHKVAKGDTLATISKQYYGDTSMVNEIMKLNGLSNADKIYLGQNLKLPQ